MRALLFETVTGDPVMDLQVRSWSYDTGILAPDSLQVEVPAYTRWASSLDLRKLLVRDLYSIALVDDEVRGYPVVSAAGPIVSPKPAEDENGNNTYEVECRGIERLLEWRQVRKYPGWPLLNSAGFPTGTYDQTFENQSYGTIIKSLVSESEKFEGGALPIVYEPDRSGIHARTQYSAVDGKSILEAMDQIADLSDGVEYDFVPQINSLEKISYKLITGTDSERVISRDNNVTWNLGGKNPDIRNYEREPDPSPVITDSVFAGGKEDDRVLLARGQYHTPLGLGYPRAELWDSSHSTVSRQATLQSWANGALGEIPDKISFQVKAKVAHGVRHGDLVRVVSQGHWDLPNGEYDFRVLSVARSSENPGWVSIGLV